MKKLFFLVVVCFFSFAASAQESMPGILSSDSKKVDVTINRPPQRVVTRTVDRTETVTAQAIDSLQHTLDDRLSTLSNAVREDDNAQNRTADYLETANAERWRWYEILGLICISLLGLWGVLHALDLNRVQVQVQNPQPTPTPPTPTNDEIRAIVLETLGREGDYFRSSAYAESRGIAVRSGGNVTIITGGSKKERKRAILLGTPVHPAADTAPQGGNQTTAPAAAGSQE